MKKIISILAVIMLLTACGGKAEYDPKNLMSNADVKKMFTNANDFKGKSIKITGKVFNGPDNDGETMSMQVWNNTEKSDDDFLVYAPKDDTIKEGDYVIVEGLVDGVFEGENAFGAKITSPTIVATKVAKSNYQNVVAPTKKEVKVNKTITQHKVDVKLEKIEFSDKDTRIYVSVNNKSKEKFNIYDFNAELVVDGKQFGEQYNYDANYPKLESNISAKAKSSGVIVMKPVSNYDGKNVRILLDGNSDDYNLDFKKFEYNFKVK